MRANLGPRLRRDDGLRRGFSLAELCVVLAVAAIAAAVAAPNFHELIRSQQLHAAAGDFFGAVALTRAQAIARNEAVKLVPNDEAGQDWTAGWTVFVDRDGDRTPGEGDDILASHPPLPPGLRIDFSFPSKTPAHYIAYNGAGRSCSDTNPAASRPGTLSLFHGDHVRRIKINMLGRARLCNPARERGCEGAEAPP
ncbi:type-4 fimbrial pilin related signal peptide protein [Massilia sp. KIM]|uniref:GspH/FimT family pseudopilin n=1 Tax=Massilia sp. KIM TaxID=1955422 RepID=UPI00098F1E14|nr:GspH/FimT family protein [Massilia sp. KIM]OON63684.1 type-4 fimbrial pilin related signal peptide protein [Massilia sp. KIM]